MKEIGQYKIQGKIDAGGMATVYRGVQESLNRPVAIKVLHKQFSENSDIVQRFNNESLIIARLTHPNIIHIIDRGITEKGMPYFVMDFVEGTDTSRIITEDAYTLNQRLDIIIQVCKGLSYAHKNGVIHRDIKPANILIDKEGNAVVTDFGIAQLYDENAEEDNLTKENMVMGTLAYMSPEQKVSSRNITASSDIYSLGVVMYELLTGVKPMGRFKSPSELKTEIPEPVDQLILKCLEPDPGDRPSTADVVKDRLLGLLNGAHISASKAKEAIKGVPRMQDIFSLLDIIKEHPFGAVYLFRHKVNENLMVVKRFSQPMGGYDAALALKELRHKNIVDIIGMSGDESNYVIVMEYLAGGSLADRLATTFEWKQAAKIIKSVLQGLAFAHQNSIMHGNLRPSNILFTSNNKVKVSDFGLNAHYARDPDKSNWFGKNNQPVTEQADIFSAGAILYKMLTGNEPIIKKNSFVFHKSFADLPKRAKALVARMLSNTPDIQFQSVEQVIEYMDGRSVSGKKGEKEALKAVRGGSRATEKSDRRLKRKKNIRLIIFFLLLLIIAGFISYLIWSNQLPEYLEIVKGLWLKVRMFADSVVSYVIKKGWFRI